MDLAELIAALKKEGKPVRPPVRVRRKAQEAITQPRRREPSVKKKAGLKRRSKRYRATLFGSYVSLANRYRSLDVTRKRKGLPTHTGFELTAAEWLALWRAAGSVEGVGGIRKSAFKLRGRRNEDVKLLRIDKTGPVALRNVRIMHGKRVLVDGRTLNV